MPEVSPVLERREHDHGRCAADALVHAEAICAAGGLRFTEQRRRVLEALLASHVPASAYDVIDRIGATGAGGHRLAPISVYRALDFLVANGFAHRIESRNAYVACDRGRDCDGEATLFLLCESCGAAGEVSSATLNRVIAEAAGAVGFAPRAPVVEVRGLCARCR